MTTAKDRLDAASRESEIAFERFRNGLKLDGKQRHQLLGVMFALKERVHELEQRVWELEREVERLK